MAYTGVVPSSFQNVRNLNRTLIFTTNSRLFGKKDIGPPKCQLFLHTYSKFCVPDQEKVDEATQKSREGGGTGFSYIVDFEQLKHCIISCHLSPRSSNDSAETCKAWEDVSLFQCMRFGSFEKILKNSGADVKLQGMNCHRDVFTQMFSKWRVSAVETHSEAPPLLQPQNLSGIRSQQSQSKPKKDDQSMARSP